MENRTQWLPEGLQRMAAECGFNFPVCYDETQTIAKIYAAACTPDFYYRGQIDDSRPSNGKPVTGADLRAAKGFRTPEDCSATRGEV
jgi:hypothetical protein